LGIGERGGVMRHSKWSFLPEGFSRVAGSIE
jgi:hypothetical protein